MRRVTRLEGSEGLWSPRCTADGRILAKDLSAQLAESSSPKATRRAHFKVRDPASGRWTSLAVELRSRVPPGPDPMGYPACSRDGRHVYANAGPWIVRFDARSGRLETVTETTGFGDWVFMTSLDPNDNPLITRDMARREIVVMDIETR